MSKLTIGSSILAIIIALGYATAAPNVPNAPTAPAPNLPKDPGPVAPNVPAPAPAPGACVHTTFKTQLVEQACAKGGQKEAKEAMKTFMKDKKIKSCNECHAKLAPKYELKADGLETFMKVGGK